MGGDKWTMICADTTAAVPRVARSQFGLPWFMPTADGTTYLVVNDGYIAGERLADWRPIEQGIRCETVVDQQGIVELTSRENGVDLAWTDASGGETVEAAVWPGSRQQIVTTDISGLGKVVARYADRWFESAMVWLNLDNQDTIRVQCDRQGASVQYGYGGSLVGERNLGQYSWIDLPLTAAEGAWLDFGEGGCRMRINYVRGGGVLVERMGGPEGDWRTAAISGQVLWHEDVAAEVKGRLAQKVEVVRQALSLSKAEIR